MNEGSMAVAGEEENPLILRIGMQNLKRVGMEKEQNSKKF
jgi:hypothetical protein